MTAESTAQTAMATAHDEAVETARFIRTRGALPGGGRYMATGIAMIGAAIARPSAIVCRVRLGTSAERTVSIMQDAKTPCRRTSADLERELHSLSQGPGASRRAPFGRRGRWGCRRVRRGGDRAPRFVDRAAERTSARSFR